VQRLDEVKAFDPVTHEANQQPLETKIEESLARVFGKA
jgi:hypothetical protein